MYALRWRNRSRNTGGFQTGFSTRDEVTQAARCIIDALRCAMPHHWGVEDQGGAWCLTGRDDGSQFDIEVVGPAT